MTLAMDLTVGTCIQQEEGLVASDMAGEKVMMSIQSGKYFNLGAIGGRIWELSAEPVIIRSIVLQLMEEYEIAYDACEAQVLAFIKMLRDEHLIRTLT